ncbi:MAG: aromatic amino acid lyase, partial [Clostridiaceae bacterium]
MDILKIDGKSLNLKDFISVTRGYRQVELSKEAVEAVIKAREVVDRYVEEKRVVYGITTGFGKFCDTVIDTNETSLLQKNLIISHACGVGEPLAEDIVRGIILLRVNALSKGFSGIRLETLNGLIEML